MTEPTLTNEITPRACEVLELILAKLRRKIMARAGELAEGGQVASHHIDQAAREMGLEVQHG